MGTDDGTRKRRSPGEGRGPRNRSDERPTAGRVEPTLARDTAERAREERKKGAGTVEVDRDVSVLGRDRAGTLLAEAQEELAEDLGIDDAIREVVQLAEGFGVDDDEVAEPGEAATESPGSTGLPEALMRDVADAVLEFCIKSTGVALRDYQRILARRFVHSVVLEDSNELTALFARQTGKTETIAVILAGLLVILPVLAAEVPDPRLKKFENGVHVGVFGPSYGIVDILCRRIEDRLHGKTMREVMQDPELGLAGEHVSKSLWLPNGSRVVGHSTLPQVNIEGHTYHLLVLDETQRIPDWRIRKSIHPMGAETAATIVKIGTPVPYRCEFYEACQRNRRRDVQNGGNWKTRTHFEFDYTHAARCSPRYANYVKQEIERLGYESDDFRLSYRLHWLLERGQFLAPEQIDERGVRRKVTLTAPPRRPQVLPGQMPRGGSGKRTFELPSNVVTFDATNRHVAGIDIGRSHDSTVITVGRPWYDFPVQAGDKEVYHTHVANWLELMGDDHETQYPKIVDFLKNYRLDGVLVDATGRGDPVYSRLRADLEHYGIPVYPFVFSAPSKHEGYAFLLQEWLAGRVTFPAGAPAARLAKFRRFLQQMYDLEKRWRGKYMTVEAPSGGRGGARLKDAHDDYPDSLMLMVMATQRAGPAQEVDVAVNPLWDHRRSTTVERMRHSRAWWRG